MKLRINVLDRDICCSCTDLTIVPCSGRMKKIEKARNQARIDFYGLPRPFDLKDEFAFGKVSPIFPPTRNVGDLKFFAFAASVRNKSDPIVLEKIGKQIGTITMENEQIRIVETPFLGCGDGGTVPQSCHDCTCKGIPINESS